MEDVNSRRRIFLSLSKLGCGLQAFNSRKFLLHLTRRVEIIATTFEKMQQERAFILIVTFSLPLPSSLLKLPNTIAICLAFKVTKLCALICFQGALAKKPYNPILGETFHCCWKVPCASKPHKTTINSHIEHPSTETDDGKLTFVAEQVSHHPPSEYLGKIQDLGVRKPINANP